MSSSKNNLEQIEIILWSDFLNSLEPILAQKANSLSRAAKHSGAVLRPTRKTLLIFLRFPPAEFLF